MLAPEKIPVIIAIGEITQNHGTPAEPREPVALMEDALVAANRDGGGSLLDRIRAVSVIGQITWRYSDPARLLCDRLGIAPDIVENASMGGETPIRLLHEAAIRIAHGDGGMTAIVSGEALHALRRARKTNAALNWTPQVSRAEAVKVPFDKLPIHPASGSVGVTAPVHIYPLYENAWRAGRGQSPLAGIDEAAALWEGFARVAAGNPYSWTKEAPTAQEIATVDDGNRMIAYPYPKRMVANPNVNQAAAVIVASLAEARAAGVPERQIVHVLGGAAAEEPADYLLRDSYSCSGAQHAVLDAAARLAAASGRQIDLLELYSCFPIVPAMALATLEGWISPLPEPTVTGGLSFFGGPLNGYMNHAVCAMVRALRTAEGKTGLLYGQGGVVSKHHALIVSSSAGSGDALPSDYSVQAVADAARGPVPELAEHYSGPASIETFTIIHGIKGQPLHGVVVGRTPDGRRMIARVDRADQTSMAMLADPERSPIGASGHVRIDVYGRMIWEAGDLRDRSAIAKKYCSVQREGALTIVTIDRPEAMNALHPMANEELAEIFDAFEADPEQWVAILTGAGDKAFSSGNDLKYTARAMTMGEPIDVPLSGFAGLSTRWNLTKPVIAAVNGVAMGGGFEIALACDLIVASEHAVFSLPEPKVGLAALAGGLHRLPRQIGLKAAMGMILTGRRVSAGEGKELGFVNEVAPGGELMARARYWAAEIMACSPMSIRASKQAVIRGLDKAALNDAFACQQEGTAMRALFASEDFREGPRAFAEKRPPQWSGR